jgi:CRISPR system Cascade subunit CasA
MPDDLPLSAISFDLRDDPWLPCLRVDGTTDVLSLRAALHQAGQIRDLVPDTPTQYPPILRMLLAVLHRALRDPRNERCHPGVDKRVPQDDDDWEELFAEGSFHGKWIDGYLDSPRVAGRLDLFNPVAPFMQTAWLRAANGETKTVALLIPHIASGHNVPLFSADRDAAPSALTPAEAARWLLHAHAWDTAAIKTGAEGDPAVTMGKTTANPTGPLGRLGVLIPCGPTLWHTLMFNLLGLEGQGRSSAGDLPAWEQQPLTPQWRPRPAKGLLDVYTWPSRRIRLIPEHEAGKVLVRKVVICAGDRLDQASELGLDPHTAFGRSEEQEKKLKRVPVYQPWRHRADRRLWRGLGAILARERTTSATTGGAEPPRYRRAVVLEQLGNDVRGDVLRDTVVRLRGFGITYGNKAAVIDDVYADEMPLPVALLRGRQWERAALDAVAAADRVAGCLSGLATDIGRASGCTDEKLLRAMAAEPRTRLYTCLDIDFPGWISQLPRHPPEDALADWCAQVRKYADKIADDVTGTAPPGAIAGRQVKQRGQDDTQQVWITAATAELAYRRGSSRALAIGRAGKSQQEGTAA